MTRPQDLRMFKPYADEVPWDLLAGGGVDAEALAVVLELDLFRIAKLEGRVVGAYGIRPLTRTRYELVSLAVDAAHRGKGFGRWLLGHAIGLAESRGAREVLVCNRAQTPFLRRFGFAPDGAHLLLELVPE